MNDIDILKVEEGYQGELNSENEWKENERISGLLVDGPDMIEWLKKKDCDYIIWECWRWDILKGYDDIIFWDKMRYSYRVQRQGT